MAYSLRVLPAEADAGMLRQWLPESIFCMKTIFHLSPRRYFVCSVLTACAGSVAAATIFECEALSSGRFYSTGDCSAHRAVIVSRHQVPDGLPFNQQVDLINKKKAAHTSAQAATDQAFDRNQQCAGINAELKKLHEKYGNWQHIPVDEVNTDQQKERDLRTKRSQLGCAAH